VQVSYKYASEADMLNVVLFGKAAKQWRDDPCGESGGWIHCRVMSDEELTDIYSFIHAKKKPI